MEVRVKFRFNKVTGEVEVFDVDQEKGAGASEADHNRSHDRIAAEIGRIIDRNPLVEEQFPGISVSQKPQKQKHPTQQEPDQTEIQEETPKTTKTNT